MEIRELKDWTILNYANGNNEYEPEMYKALNDSASAGSDESVNIVMQIGRIEREVAKIIRPFEDFKNDDEMWTGVRRYHIREHKPEFLEDLGKINMADPKSLYEFITWGIENYPAKHFMLILGGHGAAFVGTLTDYSQEAPYIMGTVEMCRAINMILKDTGSKIDILVLDICYMNLAEIMYEFGKEKQNTVKNVITYIETGPVSGLPYDRLIDIIKDNGNTDDINKTVKDIVELIGFSLVALEINPTKLKNIKKASNELAYSYLTNMGEKKYTPYELLTSLNSEDPWHEQVINLQNELSSIIVHHRRVNNQKGNLLNIIFLQLKELLNVYYKLGFAKTNYWTYLIGNKPINENLSIKTKESFKPIKIKPEDLCSLIQAMNPYINNKSLDEILEKLTANRGW
jgi:hypothetical protein